MDDEPDAGRAKDAAVRVRLETARPEIVVSLPDELPGLDPPDPDALGRNVPAQAANLPAQPAPTASPTAPSDAAPTAPPEAPRPARYRESRGGPSGPAHAPRPSPMRRAPRQPWFAVPTLVLVSLAAAFFGWVSANPFWLALGHGHHGTAAVVAFDPQGSAGTPCQARFVADGGVFTVASVAVSGVPEDDCQPGAQLSAQMVSADASQAYVASSAGLHLRWMVGFAAVLLCGLVIAWATGSARFSGWQRAVALLASLGAPLLITAGMLLAAY